MKIKKEKTIIFDLDDTLVNSTLAYSKALKAVGLFENSEEYLRARKIVKESFGGAHVSARNRLLYFKKYLELSGNFSALELLSMMQKYEEALESEVRRQWSCLGRDLLIEELSDRYHLAIITNENLRTQIIKLRAIDPFGKYFSRICTSEEVGIEKPDLKIFNKFLESQDVQPEQCYMVGDSIDNDYLPALAIGMIPVLTSEFVGDREKQDGLTIIESLWDLPVYLKMN